MRAGHNQYAPMPGVLALREAIAARSSGLRRTIRAGHRDHRHGRRDRSAVYDDHRIRAARRQVIVFEPCYDSYVPAIELSGGTPVFVTLRYPDYGSTGTR